jgi:ATP-dependent HslUV protease ATP-binding subunit HslU
MSAATSSRSPATWSRKRSGWSASGGAKAVEKAAEEAAMERLLDALTGKGSSAATRDSFEQRFAEGSLDKAEVEIEVHEAPAMPFDIPGMGGQVG